MDHNQIVGFLWNIANLIRDHYKRSKYPDVILPFTVLRRIDCVLAPSKEQVYAKYTRFKDQISAEALAKQLQIASGFVFYNTSRYDFQRLLQDQDAIYANVIDYLNGFSDNMREVIGHFKLRNTIEDLHEAGLLYLVVQSFAQVDLHPDLISNHQMGTIFEELIRRFNEASNENPGEHFTPRDVVRLMVDLLLAGDDDFINTPGRIIKLSDPCAGTGGMLTIGKERIEAINPAVQVYLYGQEVNPETYAVCKSDLYMKSADGRDAEEIKQGSTLSDDQHRGESFHYQITNPPYGKDWRIDEKAVRAEARLGFGGRFGAGLPRTSDGQLLFLQHMLAHRFDPGQDHSRVAIIMNGSPLFTGDAGSGESEIRRWVIEHDWLEAIIALPEQLFYNTGIATYIWILSNDKPDRRQGKVQLIDATALWQPLRKSLGDKRREISDLQRAQIVDAYLDGSAALTPGPSPMQLGSTAGRGEEPGVRVKLFNNADFGFRKITVERPLRLNFQASPERLARLDEQRAFQSLAQSRKRKRVEKEAEEAAGRAQQEAIRAMVGTLPDTLFTDRKPFLRALNRAAKAADLKLTKSLRGAIVDALGERDPEAAVCLDGKGQPEPDTALRDSERVPLSEAVETYFAREVQPHVPDAWVSAEKRYCDDQDGQPGKVGFEINFNRYFYTYTPPRPLAAIEADIQASQARIAALLKDML
ncbi:MAG: SAM-dependent DNA methyltransferase [Anaerolineae bacterium]|nr:SAM-dependent DNA methyltransferase [Anaerolineae bacterium]